MQAPIDDRLRAFDAKWRGRSTPADWLTIAARARACAMQWLADGHTPMWAACLRVAHLCQGFADDARAR